MSINREELEKLLKYNRVIVVGGAVKDTKLSADAIAAGLQQGKYYQLQFVGGVVTAEENAKQGEVIPSWAKGKRSGLTSNAVSSRNIFSTGADRSMFNYITEELKDAACEKTEVETTVDGKRVMVPSLILNCALKVGRKTITFTPTKQFHYKDGKQVMTTVTRKNEAGQFVTEQMSIDHTAIVFFEDEIDSFDVIVAREKKRLGVILSAEEQAEADAADKAAEAVLTDK